MVTFSLHEQLRAAPGEDLLVTGRHLDCQCVVVDVSGVARGFAPVVLVRCRAVSCPILAASLNAVAASEVVSPVKSE